MKRTLAILFLFLYLIALIYCGEMRIAWISPTNSAQYPINAESSATGAKFGVQSIRSNKALLKNQFIRLKHFDTNCNSRSAIAAFMLARSTYDPDVVIGPPCADALRSVSELASFHNLPVMAWIAPNREFDDKTAHPTLIRMQPPVNEMTSVLQYLFYLMSWRKFTLLYVRDGNSNEAMGEAVEAVARMADISLLSSHALNHLTTDEEIKQILSQIKLYSRVIVLAVPWADMRRYMLIASKLDMTNGEYVFICLDRQIYTEDQLSQVVLSSYGWQRSDNFDKEAKQAFESVLHIIVDPLNEDRDEPVTKKPKNRYKEFLQVTGRIMGNKDVVGVEVPKGTQPDPNALFLYDTILVWAVLAGTLTNKMENYRDGAKMSEVAKDFYATGASGHIAININRDRAGKVFILDMNDNGEFQPIQVIRFNSSGNYDMFSLVEPSRMFIWGNGKAGINNAPSDEPNITALCPTVATKQPIFRPETLSRSMILTPPFNTRERLPVLERIKLAQQIISDGARKPLTTKIMEATVTPKQITLPVITTRKPVTTTTEKTTTFVPTTTTERTTTFVPTTTTERTTTTTSPYITTTTLAPTTTPTTVTTTTTTTSLPVTTTNLHITVTVEPTTGKPDLKPSPEGPAPAETLELTPKANIIGDWPKGKNGVQVEQRMRMPGGPRAGPQRQPGARRRIRLRPGQDPPGAALKGRQGPPTRDHGSHLSPEEAIQIAPETSTSSEPVASAAVPQSQTETPSQPEFPSQQHHPSSSGQHPPPQEPPSRQTSQSEPRTEVREPTVREPHMQQGGPHSQPRPPQQNMIRNQNIPQPASSHQTVHSHSSSPQQPPIRQPQPPPQQPPSFQQTPLQQSPQHPQPQQPPAHHSSPQQPPPQRQPPPPPQRQPPPPPQRQPPPPPQRQPPPPPQRQPQPPPQRQPPSPVQSLPSVTQGQPSPSQVQPPHFKGQIALEPQGQPQQAFHSQGPPLQPPNVMMPPRPPPQRPNPPPVIRQVQVNSWAPVIPPSHMEPVPRPSTWSGHATIAPVPDFWGGWTGPQTTTATWWEALM